MEGAWLTHGRLLRPARSGIFLRSFHLHSDNYAREKIAKICSLGASLATAPMGQPGSGSSKNASEEQPFTMAAPLIVYHAK